MMFLILKLGGKLLASESLLEEQLNHFVDFSGPKILVHGGGILADQMLKQLGISSVMTEGRRITSPECLKILTMVYSGLSQTIAAKLVSRGLNPLCLSGSSGALLESRRRAKGSFDYGEVGDLVRLRSQALVDLLNRDFVPVISPLTCDKNGRLLNTNADSIAGFLATSLSQAGFDVSLNLSFELNGIMSNIRDSASQISVLNLERYKKMLNDGSLSQGILPKTKEGFSAIRSGVREVFIGKYRSDGFGIPTKLVL